MSSYSGGVAGLVPWFGCDGSYSGVGFLGIGQWRDYVVQRTSHVALLLADADRHPQSPRIFEPSSASRAGVS